MNQLRINTKADIDIDTEASFIAQQFGLDRGIRFYDACEEAFNQLLAYPQIGKVREFSNISIEIRRWQVKGFTDYLIFYRLVTNEQTIAPVRSKSSESSMVRVIWRLCFKESLEKLSRRSQYFGFAILDFGEGDRESYNLSNRLKCPTMHHALALNS